MLSPLSRPWPLTKRKKRDNGQVLPAVTNDFLFHLPTNLKERNELWGDRKRESTAVKHLSILTVCFFFSLDGEDEAKVKKRQLLI